MKEQEMRVTWSYGSDGEMEGGVTFSSPHLPRKGEYIQLEHVSAGVTEEVTLLVVNVIHRIIKEDISHSHNRFSEIEIHAQLTELNL
jgi:hypothetical protein